MPVKQPVLLSATAITPEQEAQLHAIVDAKAGMVAKAHRPQVYAQIRTRFNRHLQTAKYSSFPLTVWARLGATSSR